MGVECSTSAEDTRTNALPGPSARLGLVEISEKSYVDDGRTVSASVDKGQDRRIKLAAMTDKMQQLSSKRDGCGIFGSDSGSGSGSGVCGSSEMLNESSGQPALGKCGPGKSKSKGKSKGQGKGKGTKKTSTQGCEVCSLPAFARCCSCRQAWYCSTDCQRVDWLKHKDVCCSMEDQKRQQAVNELLLESCYLGDELKVRDLIAGGKADVDFADKSSEMHLFRPLLAAAAMGHPGVVAALCSAGANIDSIDSNGFSALHHAAEGGHVDAIKQLILYGADMNIKTHGGQGATPLMLGTKSLKAVRTLLEAGADPNLATCDGATALSIATHFRHLGSVVVIERVLLAAAARA